MRTIPGLENVKMAKPAYGVEYDFVDPRELSRAYNACSCAYTHLNGILMDSHTRDEAHQSKLELSYVIVCITDDACRVFTLQARSTEQQVTKKQPHRESWPVSTLGLLQSTDHL